MLFLREGRKPYRLWLLLHCDRPTKIFLLGLLFAVTFCFIEGKWATQIADQIAQVFGHVPLYTGVHRREGWWCTVKEMDMIWLHVESTYCPGIGFAETTDFLFEKRCKLAHQNLCAVCADNRQSDRPMYM
jgi:hypothetical protein